METRLEIELKKGPKTGPKKDPKKGLKRPLLGGSGGPPRGGAGDGSPGTL